MEKTIKDGQTAVLYTPDISAGWFSSNHNFPQCLYEPEIVQAVLAGKDEKDIQALARAKYGDEFYAGGARDLKVAWLPVGMRFKIHDYEGAESIEYRDADDWQIA